jgi:hypothetical protein
MLYKARTQESPNILAPADESSAIRFSRASKLVTDTDTRRQAEIHPFHCLSSELE